MDEDKVTRAFGVIDEEINAIIQELNDEGAQAFRHGRYEEVDRLRQVGAELAVFRGSVEQLQTLWVSKFCADNSNTAQPKTVTVQPKPLREQQSSPPPKDTAKRESTGLLGRLDQF